ncbi:alanine racemase [Arcanobacterium wilhelmae]|uniref:Alanine racemase n=1 Tax=Arcanobacterium wilhelmae TaxID=1803177 RepID=A0ABT9NDH2_9ACTO|nr:alanine racemase [Arcanobacterium wilhelmae]MDP9801421.1 alanine racemase [Arcanobacterium wilhelmae]WFN90756.1 alanine racemase [Arcanobacterium wilhelmae]
MSYPSRAYISKSAFEHNLEVARELAPTMAIVKANAYGHGIEFISRWGLGAGVEWFGAAQLEEALHLRHLVGPVPRVFTWIYAPGANLRAAVENVLDVSVGSQWALRELATAAREVGATARVHVEVDTGMARGGVNPSDLDALAAELCRLQAEGAIEVVSLWSHLANADSDDDSLTIAQTARFEEARAAFAQAGVVPEMFHLAASGGALWHPATRYDMIRPGAMLYGLSPNMRRASAESLGLEPVMRLEADVVAVRDVPAGTGISYGHTEIAVGGHLAVVPLGYGDGIPRSASRNAYVSLGGERAKIMGNVCMDQFIVEVPGAAEGDVAVLFGGAHAPSADDWGEAAGTIGYEIVTRIGPRVARIPVA